MKKTLLLTILFFLFLVQQVNGIDWTYITTDKQSRSFWNETFIRDENKTFWITIPKNVRVGNAKLNLSGYNITQKPLNFYDNFSTTDYIDSLTNLTRATKSSNCEYYENKIIPSTKSFYDTFSDGITQPCGQLIYDTSGNGVISEENGVLMIQTPSDIDHAHIYTDFDGEEPWIEKLNFKIKFEQISPTSPYMIGIISVNSWNNVDIFIYLSPTGKVYIKLNVYEGDDLWWTGSSWSTSQTYCASSYNLNQWYDISIERLSDNKYKITTGMCSVATTPMAIDNLEWMHIGENSDRHSIKIYVDNLKLIYTDLKSGEVISKYLTTYWDWMPSIFWSNLTKTDYVPSGSTITYYMSNNGGNTWEQVTPNTKHYFTSRGTLLKWKAVIIPNNEDIPYIDDIRITMDKDTKYQPTNPYLDSANSDIPFEWSLSGKLNQTNSPQQVDLNSTIINNYLSTCTPDSNGNCDVPFKLHSDTAGIIQISNINISIGSPKWSNNSTSIPTVYNPTTPSIFNITWDDVPGYSIDTVYIEINHTGTFVNYTMNLINPYISESENKGIYSWNATLPAGYFCWRSYANASDVANVITDMLSTNGKIRVVTTDIATTAL